MTELRTGQLGSGFFAAQQTRTSRETRQNEVSGGFMQSLKQTGTAAVDMGQTANKTVTRTATSANKPADTTVKAENTADKTVRSETAAGISETSSAAGTVKVDEKAVKELNDLKEAAGKTDTSSAVNEGKNVDGTVGGQSENQLSDEDNAVPEFGKADANTENAEKSRLEQAKEALENAMLKAFKELNDPDKKQEEFEEKLLLFLMKLADSINGKNSIKSPLTSEEDEEEEKIGGTLMEIIENMIKNAEKNAEMNPEQTAASNAAFIGNYFLNPGNLNEGGEENEGIGIDVSRNIELEAPGLYPELDDLIGRDGRIGTNPVITPVYSQAVGGIKGESEILGINPAAENTANSVRAASDTADVNPVHIEEAVHTATPWTVLNSGGNFAAENTVQTKTAVLLPVTEHVVNIEGNNPDTNFSQTSENSSFQNIGSSAIAETLPEESYGTFTADSLENSTELTAGKAAERLDETVENIASKTAAAETASQAAETPVKTGSLQNSENIVSNAQSEAGNASNELYEQIALSVYKDAKETLKEAYAERGRETPLASVSADMERTSRTEPESELDELARLFGLKKEEDVPPMIEREEENEETDSFGSGANFGKNEDTGAKESIFGADISISSVKAVDAPIPRTLPAGGSVSRVVTQIVNQILGNLPEKGQETTLTVTLNPETLGKISLKLVENAGKISVTITAENKETAAILASRAESVQESMRDQGTQLEKYQVVYGAEQDGRAEQQNYEGSSKNPYVRDTEEENDDSGEFEKILQSEV